MDKDSSKFSSSAAPTAVYGHPRPALRRLTARIIAAGLALALVGAAGQTVMALALGAAGLLLWISTLFTLGFAAVLAALATLHPELTACEDGLLLRPLLGRSARVAWSALAGIEPHPLIFNNEGTGRLLHGKNYRPRAGLLVVARPGAGLPARYRLVDLVTGGPGRPVFAISSATHADYERLERLIRARIMT
ncbi:MAG: hypothetical protein IT323_09290 [Anaerolineae bacterium]|nr:hypothetical protein [Anaerolineae bacterium]